MSQLEQAYSFHLLLSLLILGPRLHRFHKMIWAAFALIIFGKKLYKIGINHPLKVWHNSKSS